MSIVDLLTLIIGITILVTITLGALTYLAYKLHRSRRSAPHKSPADGPWYFVRYSPDTPSDEEA